ncbi:regulator of telomere elongation helicase 1 homolog isoform X1 [Ziziphus jujuba]|uniref:Regulator of telomere elongation helicase 1 homolog isoform X1 n=1 Tax=Ziziphus jujuba TaxID=326968 RepID=A0A6P3YY15_ZIZJJ|nr:regulator of telomere elongation helicase 1 homolog isoform X1 [Ziziphus jujuba]
MPTYTIRGIGVDFPFEAYDCQLVYMDKVIQSLQNKCNALLESPTGTGKTLCLLCATLAWRKSLGPFSTGMSVNSSQDAGGKGDTGSQSSTTRPPTIVYASRTHSQIRQVIQELKRTSYRPKTVVLGSREQMCIHDEVSLLSGRAQTNACRFICRKREKTKKDENNENHRCRHFSRVSGYLMNNPNLGDEPIDIEDLVNIGKRHGPCPYYVSREIHKVADILFAPYNYLIDRGNRKSLSINWKNCILIFDEAHNLESLCADAASFDLTSGLLTACISEAKSCTDLCIKRREQSNDKSRNPENFAILRALLLKLEKRIAEVTIQSKELGFSKPGPYIYELLADLNITHETASKLIDIIKDAVELLEEDNQRKVKGTICRLESISDILNLIFRDKENAHANFYRVHVQEVDASATDGLKGRVSRKFSWWCFNPGIAMEEFRKLDVGSIILTSGTLSPMDSFAQELKLEFPVRLENPHVISANQIWAGVLPTGPSGGSFNSSYRSRDSLEYKQELGNAIVNFARIVPDGLLVFFPSYYLLDQCMGCWKNVSAGNSTTIWERICKHKKPVVEPRQSSLFPLSIEDYMTKLKDTSTSGAVFFAVCRGKVSEGLDFADHAGRAVVITGLPYATMTDPKVRLKREYLDQQAISQRELCKSEVLTGEDWYSQQASRAVNQAIGRVIRHRHDYGAIIFCDERFTHSNRQSQISRWIQPHIQCYSKFGDVVYTLTRFFRDGETRGPTKLKLLESEKLGKSVVNEQIEEAPLDDMPSFLGSSASAQRSTSELKTEQPLDKFYLEKFLPLTRRMGQDCTVKPPSSQHEVSRGDIFNQFGEVLPANRSSFTSYKDQSTKLNYSNELLFNEKKSLVSERKAMQFQNCRITDLSCNSMMDVKPSNQLMAPCSVKKRRLNTEHEKHTKNEHLSHAKNFGLNGLTNISNSMVCENPHESNSGSSQSGEDMALMNKDSRTLTKRETEILDQKNKVVQSSSADEETKGSEFLVQVEGKLSASEYKEFVNSMKALKSKAMKISEVLQTIARLFSSPERLSLFKRFKDFIPAKYHAMYEQYFGN